MAEMNIDIKWRNRKCCNGTLTLKIVHVQFYSALSIFISTSLRWRHHHPFHYVDIHVSTAPAMPLLLAPSHLLTSSPFPLPLKAFPTASVTTSTPLPKVPNTMPKPNFHPFTLTV